MNQIPKTSCESRGLTNLDAFGELVGKVKEWSGSRVTESMDSDQEGMLFSLSKDAQASVQIFVWDNNFFF